MKALDIDKARRRLMDEIAAEARTTAFWTGREAFSDRVMAALAKVPRHAFVREADLPVAYANRPQGIGHGQTISQPYIVALMTDILEIAAGHRVLGRGGARAGRRRPPPARGAGLRQRRGTYR